MKVRRKNINQYLNIELGKKINKKKEKGENYYEKII